ncbi:SMI1/KNR4 family protein [Paenibacillus elgii]
MVNNKYLGDDNIDSFLQFLKQYYDNELISCDENDMIQLTQLVADRKLPEAYLKFIKCAGRGYIMFNGSDYSIKDIEKFKDLKVGALELLEECGYNKKIGDDQFVFMGHQGYMYWFFNFNDGDNPPVYFFEESYDESNTESEFIKLSDTFSEFLIKKYNGELPRY